MSTLLHGTRNGVDVDQLVATVSAVEQTPELARFQFRTHTDWIDGGHSRTTVQNFHGAGQEDTSRAEPFVLEGDEPPVLLGANHAPNAVEVILHALASCLAVGFIYNAAAQGINVRSLDFDLEGDLDLRGFLGLSDQVRSGYEGVRVIYLGRRGRTTGEARGALRPRSAHLSRPGHPAQPGTRIHPTRRLTPQPAAGPHGVRGPRAFTEQEASCLR